MQENGNNINSTRGDSSDRSFERNNNPNRTEEVILNSPHSRRLPGELQFVQNPYLHGDNKKMRCQTKNVQRAGFIPVVLGCLYVAGILAFVVARYALALSQPIHNQIYVIIFFLIMKG